MLFKPECNSKTISAGSVTYWVTWLETMFSRARYVVLDNQSYWKAGNCGIEVTSNLRRYLTSIKYLINAGAYPCNVFIRLGGQYLPLYSEYAIRSLFCSRSDTIKASSHTSWRIWGCLHYLMEWRFRLQAFHQLLLMTLILESVNES